MSRIAATRPRTLNNIINILGPVFTVVRGVQGLHQVVGERRLHAMHWTVDQERLKFERVLVINVVKEDIFKVSGYLFGIARQSQS